METPSPSWYIHLIIKDLCYFHIFVSRKNDEYDEKNPEEVLGDRVRRIGGQDAYDPDLDPNTYM